MTRCLKKYLTNDKMSKNIMIICFGLQFVKCKGNKT